MIRMNTCNNQLYEEYEKTLKKIDKLLDEILSMRNEQKELKDTIKTLTKELEKLRKENEKLKSQINKNSTNSGKPSSTDIVTPKKSGANLYNSRQKTNKKIGGQKGHKGYNLSKENIETMIKENKIKVKEIKHYIKGNSKKEAIVKYKVGIDVKPIIEKHIFIYDEKSTDVLPVDFYTDVTYDKSIKALTVELGSYNVISYDRLSDFFNVITNGVIKISNGTLVNFVKEFSNKTIPTLNNITNNLLKESSMHTDETSSKYNGKNSFVRVYDNERNALYKAHLRKGHKPIIEDNILPIYTGTIISDHDTTVYKYGMSHAECNVHLARYLEEIIQNLKGIKFAKKMKLLLFKINLDKKELLLNGLKSFNKKYLKDMSIEYDQILKEGREELGKLKDSFYLDKAITLISRLAKYKDNHLLFAYNFYVDFDNNMSEQDIRIYKIKTKVSGGFRSLEGQECFANALSIIKTSLKRNINPFKSIQDIFDNKVLFVN